MERIEYGPTYFIIKLTVYTDHSLFSSNPVQYPSLTVSPCSIPWDDDLGQIHSQRMPLTDPSLRDGVKAATRWSLKHAAIPATTPAKLNCWMGYLITFRVLGLFNQSIKVYLPEFMICFPFISQYPMHGKQLCPS